MASIRKVKDKWRAEVARGGVRRSKLFPTRVEAKDWAAVQEYQILNGAKIAAATKLSEVLARYRDEKSPAKRGARWEAMRLDAMAADKIGGIAISKLTGADIADWRDRRLKQVAPGTVRREMVLLSAVMTAARKDWGLISVSPMLDVTKPTEPPARDRRPTSDEMDRLAHVAGDDLSKATARAYRAFLFAIETGMRAGEICGLSWARVDTGRRIVHLAETKNGTRRDVPLSLAAIAILDSLPKMEPVFGLTAPHLDAIWRKMRDRAAADGLHFHDARHEAITRLSRKLDVLALAKMVGHRDIRQLQVYYDATAEELAQRLD